MHQAATVLFQYIMNYALHNHNSVAIHSRVLLQCSMENRLINVETKLAYLEDMMLTLNELLITQGKAIQVLQSHKEQVESKLTELADMNSDVPQRRPPHY